MTPNSEPTPFPFPDLPGVAVPEERLREYRDRPLMPVTLPNGREALLVTEYDDVRTVLADPRFSREAYAQHPLFARSSKNLSLATSDPPTHTRRRRAVTAPFTSRRAERDRAMVEKTAERVLDRAEAAGSPVDLVAEFCVPYAYAIVLDMLGLPESDLPTLHSYAEVLNSAGRHPRPKIDEAQARIKDYFVRHLRLRQEAIDAGNPGEDVLTHLLTLDGHPLAPDEIVTLAAGTLLAGGDTTAVHLALCLYHLVTDQDLADRLHADPTQVVPAVEELLRWAWLGHTGGQPHVALTDVLLTAGLIKEGQTVIPLPEAANRDPKAFPDPDHFDPARTPNPHTGFGHGRHMCLGAPLARIELQTALTAITTRHPRLHLAVPETEITWRDDMFLRGPWTLPVHWSR
ncbi:cytochrome P450 [Sphaerisporangium sp. TRM90804]|uniref:cytochrome P450 n=1 Tax=Sphaerisporangium sp. TRM90804 TaxID=3031113 RepID=UPI0024471C97|nr:cytochrome P450 [Sphaerisporangium sp. TRM90804]MDH2430333.1 cytochrome P450 [Sphaerisporangium sp. TRM90804]